LDQFTAGYAARMRPLYPHIQDEVFTELAEDYIGWLRRTYPHGATFGQHIKFEISFTQWPAES